MIDNPYPTDWRELQTGVARLFNEIGLIAETEKLLQTPRGEVEVDVYAVDEASVDKIRYLVECKNWSAAIPQTVVHAFTTVMSETGANIGFIVSQKGLQAGAARYTNNTSITGLTYLELQQRYFGAWWERHFCIEIGNLADEIMDFAGPFCTRRDQLVAKLSDKKKRRIRKSPSLLRVVLRSHDSSKHRSICKFERMAGQRFSAFASSGKLGTIQSRRLEQGMASLSMGATNKLSRT